jgi:hypothetical protein
LQYGYDDCIITFYDVGERTVLQDVVDTKRANEKQSGEQSLWKMGADIAVLTPTSDALLLLFLMSVKVQY